MAGRFNMDAMIQPGLTYSPRTFEQSLMIPLQYREREDRMLNDLEQARIAASNINIPNDERAKAVFNEWNNRLNSDISDLSKSISTTGVVNPNVANSLRALKSKYAQDVSRQGTIGNFARIATEMEQQRGLRAERALAEGFTNEQQQANYERERRSYLDSLSWDRITSGDSSYQLPEFVSGYAPKNVKVADVIRDLSGNIGVHTDALKDNVLTADFNPQTGLWVLTDQNASYQTSNNIAQLNSLNNIIQMQIDNPQSELMQAEIYKTGRTYDDLMQNNPEIISEIRERLSNELVYSIMSMHSSSTVNDTMTSQQVINTAGGGGGAAQPRGGQPDTSDGSARLAPSVYRGLTDFVENEYTGSLTDIANGKSYNRLEEMEQSGNLENITPEQLATAKNDVIAIQKRINDKIEEVNSNPQTKRDIYSNAYKNITAVVGNQLIEKHNKVTEDHKFPYFLNSSKTSLKKYKLPGMNIPVKDIFGTEEGYNEFQKQKDKAINAYEKVSELGESVLSNGINKRDLELLYDIDTSSLIQDLVLYEGDNGRYFLAPGGTSNTQTRGYIKSIGTDSYNTIQGRENIVKRLAEINDVDVNTMKNTLQAMTNKNLYERFDGIIKSSVAEAAMSAGTEGNFKYNNEVIFLGTGVETNKLRKQINETLTDNWGYNLYNLATQFDGAFIDTDSNRYLVNEKYSENSRVFENDFPDPKIEFQNITTNNGYTDAHIGFKISSGTGEKGKSGMLYIPLDGSSDSAVLHSLLDEIKGGLNQFDRGRIQAVQDNIKTKYIPVDNYESAATGGSKYQKEMILKAGSDVEGGQKLLDDSNYQREMAFLTDSKTANIYVDNENYYGLNYTDRNGRLHSLTVSDFITKESIKNALNSNTMQSTGYFKKDPVINDRVSAENFITEIYNISYMLENGIIKIPGIDVKSNSYFRDFKELMERPGGALENNLDTKMSISNVIYDFIKDKPIMHSSKINLTY